MPCDLFLVKKDYSVAGFTMQTYHDSRWCIHFHKNLGSRSTYIPHLEVRMRNLLKCHMNHKDFLSDQVPSPSRTDLYRDKYSCNGIRIR